MSETTTLTVRIRAKDEVTPVLRRIMAELWVMQHPRLAMVLLCAGWGLFGFTLGAIFRTIGVL